MRSHLVIPIRSHLVIPMRSHLVILMRSHLVILMRSHLVIPDALHLVTACHSDAPTLVIPIRSEESKIALNSHRTIPETGLAIAD